jgi:hypothetical protein|tara:strand:+ start:476 stop:1144 length:669 start_codon:yes stop_codon:yes gene_type:complete
VKQLRKSETTKLFYDEFPYKLVINNSLSHIFRDKNLASAKEQLTILQAQYDHGEPLIWGSHFRRSTVTHSTFVEAKSLYIEFCKQIDYKLRVSNPRMNVYSHDRDWLLMLSVKINSACEFYEPSKQHLSMLSKNVILLDTIPEYEYKITLGDRCDSNLANWIVNNPDKAKAGPVCLSTIARGAYTNGLYFYARDEKILQLLNLFLSKVVRIDKLVYKSNDDK